MGGAEPNRKTQLSTHKSQGCQQMGRGRWRSAGSAHRRWRGLQVFIYYTELRATAVGGLSSREYSVKRCSAVSIHEGGAGQNSSSGGKKTPAGHAMACSSAGRSSNKGQASGDGRPQRDTK